MFRNIIRFLDGIGKTQDTLTGERQSKRKERENERWEKKEQGNSRWKRENWKQIPAQAERKTMGKIKAVAALCMVFAVGCLAFTGCQNGVKDEEKLADLEFTVVGEADTPDALQEMIMQKKEKPFKLTYADGQDMYIVIGEGPQEGGGFSIAVRELFRTENSVVIKTELMGPEKGEDCGTEASYPVLIVKTAYCEEPVVFR